MAYLNLNIHGKTKVKCKVCQETKPADSVEREMCSGCACRLTWIDEKAASKLGIRRDMRELGLM